MQINWQLEVPIAARYKKQEGSAASRTSLTYRDGIPYVDPEAVAAVPVDVKAAMWGNITSVRRTVV